MVLSGIAREGVLSNRVVKGTEQFKQVSCPKF